MLYLECYSGISGDMTVAALLDLGADREKLLEGLASLGLSGYEVKIGRRVKCGVEACSFDVELAGDEDGGSHDYVEYEHRQGNGHEHQHGHGESRGHLHAHEHEDGHEHTHGHLHAHEHEDGHEHTNGQGYSHEHGHSHMHGYGDGHGHEHGHVHRNLGDITEIIRRSGMTERAKETALRIFGIVAEAEAKVHGKDISEVHFHEVGAVDSIVDIAAAAICLDDLDITEAVVSEICEGSGHVHCQHGILPVPVPAVMAVAEARGLFLRMTDTRGEMVTPTGAAIAAGVRTRERLPESFRILKTGIGAGKKDFPKANILRACLIEERPESGSGRRPGDGPGAGDGLCDGAALCGGGQGRVLSPGVYEEEPAGLADEGGLRRRKAGSVGGYHFPAYHHHRHPAISDPQDGPSQEDPHGGNLLRAGQGQGGAAGGACLLLSGI